MIDTTKVTLSNLSSFLLVSSVLQVLKVKVDKGTRHWAEENRVLTSKVSSEEGRMDCSRTPWMLFVMQCLDDPKIKVIIGLKSAQIAWTETINNYIGKIIDISPKSIVIAFPRLASATKFYKEKLSPLLADTPVLREKIGSLKLQSSSHITYKEAFISLVTTKTSEDLKSTSAPIIIMEEPDGATANVNNQGSSFELLSNRQKSFPDSKFIFGGTPTVAGFSEVDKAYYRESNRCEFQVPCHLCGGFHELSFDNLKSNIYSDGRIDEVYGKYDPTTAHYKCPHCNNLWTFEEKCENEQEAIKHNNLGWVITRPEKEAYGVRFNELFSTFAASNFVELERKRLKAEHAYATGDPKGLGLMIAYINNTQGRSYEHVSVGATMEELEKQKQSYKELVIPFEGLILTLGIDVQHDRFAIIGRAWGRNSNSWLVHWVEIHGNVLDRQDPVWDKLTEYCLQKFKHESHEDAYLLVSGISIDASDGHTTELVYEWVASMLTHRQHTRAVKGVGNNSTNFKEIYNEPSIKSQENGEEYSTRKTMYERSGVYLFIMGAHVAHAEVLRRTLIPGNQGRNYFCATSYPGYLQGLLSCVTLPDGSFKQKPGVAKEVIDCEKMALHSAKACGWHLFKPTDFTAIEESIFNSPNTQKDSA